jgi:hypothetical protein
VTSDDVQKALDWLVNTADAAAEARADRLQLEDFSKALLASIEVEKQNQYPSAAGNALQRMALADERYEAHLAGLRDAVRKDERFKWLRDTAHAKVEVWRSLESTKRSLKV